MTARHKKIRKTSTMVASRYVATSLSLAVVLGIGAGSAAPAVAAGKECRDVGCQATDQQGKDVVKESFTQAQHRKILELQQQLERMSVPEGYVRAFRVEALEGANQILTYSPARGVQLSQQRDIFLNFGDTYRAASYLIHRNQDGQFPNTVLRQFLVPKAEYDRIRDNAVAESEKKRFPGSAYRVDTKNMEQYGLPSTVTESLNGALRESGNKQFMEILPKYEGSTFDYKFRLFSESGKDISQWMQKGDTGPRPSSSNQQQQQGGPRTGQQSQEVQTELKQGQQHGQQGGSGGQAAARPGEEQGQKQPVENPAEQSPTEEKPSTEVKPVEGSGFEERSSGVGADEIRVPEGWKVSKIGSVVRGSVRFIAEPDPISLAAMAIEKGIDTYKQWKAESKFPGPEDIVKQRDEAWEEVYKGYGLMMAQLHQHDFADAKNKILGDAVKEITQKEQEWAQRIDPARPDEKSALIQQRDAEIQKIRDDMPGRIEAKGAELDKYYASETIRLAPSKGDMGKFNENFKKGMTEYMQKFYEQTKQPILTGGLLSWGSNLMEKFALDSKNQANLAEVDKTSPTVYRASQRELESSFGAARASRYTGVAADEKSGLAIEGIFTGHQETAAETKRIDDLQLKNGDLRPMLAAYTQLRYLKVSPNPQLKAPLTLQEWQQLKDVVDGRSTPPPFALTKEQLQTISEYAQKQLNGQGNPENTAPDRGGSQPKTRGERDTGSGSEAVAASEAESLPAEVANFNSSRRKDAPNANNPEELKAKPEDPNANKLEDEQKKADDQKARDDAQKAKDEADQRKAEDQQRQNDQRKAEDQQRQNDQRKAEDQQRQNDQDRQRQEERR